MSSCAPPAAPSRSSLLAVRHTEANMTWRTAFANAAASSGDPLFTAPAASSWHTATTRGPGAPERGPYHLLIKMQS